MTDLLITNARVITMVDDSIESPEGVAIAIKGGTIVWLGDQAGCPSEWKALPEHDAGGMLVLPGFIESHALICAVQDAASDDASFAEEVARLTEATIAASDDEIVSAAVASAAQLSREGVTSADVRTGFGGGGIGERRMIELAGRIADETPIHITRTIVPALVYGDPDRRDRLLEEIEHQLLPGVLSEGLADMVEVFCDDEAALDLDDCSTILEIAYKKKLPSRVACDRYDDSAGATLPPSFYSHAAVYLNYADHVSLDTIGAGKTVALLAPLAISQGDEHRPDIAAIRSAGIPIALTGDAFPHRRGSVLEAASQARELFGLNDIEALAGITSHAARAIGRGDLAGSIAVGKRADLTLFDVAGADALLDQPKPPAAIFVAGNLIQ